LQQQLVVFGAQEQSLLPSQAQPSHVQFLQLHFGLLQAMFLI
jgi:hypothetical protein|tara:strand:- start:2691 stop:2816 length:126 start_codon:yes stop_codon:yes gene_type:complete